MERRSARVRPTVPTRCEGRNDDVARGQHPVPSAQPLPRTLELERKALAAEAAEAAALAPAQ